MKTKSDDAKKTSKEKDKKIDKKNEKPKKPRMSKAKRERIKQNKVITRIKYIYGGLLFVIIVYLIYFVVGKSNEIIINSYNPRLEAIEENIVRGTIYDKDGLAIAFSTVNDGEITRLYPFENAFSHVVGYSTQGKTGIEALANIDLLESDLSIAENIMYGFSGGYLAGNNVVTTLDIDMQLLAYDLLGDHKGAIIAMEPSTGKILAMVSKPDYNPNYIIEDWDDLVMDRDNSPLLNRASQGLYPPGSTFKIITAMEYLEEYDESDFSYYCDSSDFFGGIEIHCAYDTAHGRVDLANAFAKSCNTAFATIGEQIDADRLHGTCNDLLFNNALPYALPYSVSSFSLNGNSSKEAIAETAIGQGETLITPLHNLLITASIANGGILMTPYLIDGIYNSDGDLLEKRFPIVDRELLDVDMSTKLTEYMTLVVNDGTAKGLQSEDYQAAAKTGSAENPFGDTHAWVVGFAPATNPEIALVILVENVGSSGQNAVPIAKEIFDFYFENNSF